MIYLYIPRYLFGQGRKILLSSHALQRADQRRISIELVRNALLCGKCEKTGKNSLRFCKRFRKGMVVCVAVQKNEIILVKTVEWKKS